MHYMKDQIGVPWSQISVNYSMWFMVMEIVHSPARFSVSERRELVYNN